MKRLYKEMALRQQRGYAESLYAVSMESLGFPIPQKIWYQAGLGDFQPVMDWLGSLGMQEAQNVAAAGNSHPGGGGPPILSSRGNSAQDFPNRETVYGARPLA